MIFADSIWTHPLGQCAGAVHEVARCRSYNLWSGIVSDLGEITLITGLALGAIKAFRAYRKHTECHEDGCTRRGRYVLEGGVRCCDLHHPALDERPESERGHVHRLHRAHIAHVARIGKRTVPWPP